MITQSMTILDRVMGDRESFNLDQRIFHFYSLFACLFCLLAIITNWLSGLYWTINVVVIILGLIFALTYWLSRVGYDRSGLIRTGQCILLVSLLPILWLLNGGVVGSASLVSLALVQYFTVVLRPAWLGLVVHFVVVACFLSLEWFYSDWITPYDSLFSQKMDMFFALSLLGVFVFGNYYFLLDENKIEREQLILKNQELEDYRQQLENTNRLLAKAQEIAKVGFFEVDLNDHKVTWSEETFRIFDRNPSLEPLTFAEFKETIHPEDWQTFQPLIDRAMKEGIPYENEKRIILNDRVKTLFSKVEAIKDKDNKVIKLFGVVQDITDRKIMEDELKKQQELLESFFSQSLDGCFFMMLDQPIEWNDKTDKEQALNYVFSHQHIVKINKVFAEQYGAREEDLIGLTPKDFFANDIEYGRKVWKEFFDHGSLHTETKEQKLDNTEIVIEGNYVCLYDEQGRITGHFGIQRDITDRIMMENELRESEERFRNLANNIPGVILRYVLHPDGTDGLHYISPGCFDLWGVSQEEALADVKKIWDRTMPDDIPSMYQSILSSAQGQTIWKHDWRICTTKGQIKWVNGIGIPSKQGNGDVIWDTIITDITDRKRSQTELELLVKQRTKDLQASQQVLEEQLKREQHLLSIIQTELKQKDTLLKEVHHRVKNNLQIISSLMRLQVDNHQDQQLKASFQDSQNRIQSMALIHERLYRSDDLSQIDTQIYFKELTDYLCQTYNTNSQNIEVILNTPPILLEIDKAIPCGLIVNELFTNSLKYAFQNKEGGTITLTSQQLDQTYNLQIKDTGNGLPPDFDLSRSRSLGLRLVDRLVKQLRGSITMQYDKGMVFLIEFPL